MSIEVKINIKDKNSKKSRAHNPIGKRMREILSSLKIGHHLASTKIIWALLGWRYINQLTPSC